MSGPIFGAAFGALIMVSSGTDWASFGWAMTVYFVAQLVDNLFTQPVIFAKRVFAHPLEIFVVVSISGSLAGTLGMVLAIPGYTLFRIVARSFCMNSNGFKRSQTTWIRGSKKKAIPCERPVDNSSNWGKSKVGQFR